MPAADSVAHARAPAPTWWLVGVATTAAGLLAGLRTYLTYNARGVAISAGDGIATGLMSWWLWIPFVPGILWLARRWEPSRGRPVRALALHAAAGGVTSFAHLSAFAALSGLVRAVRFGDPFHVDLASPLSFLLAPGFLVYWAVVALGWWRSGREAPGEVDPPLSFRAGGRRLFLRAGEIEWVAAAGNYLELHTRADTHLIRETLAGVHRRLGRERFVRIHRSTLVRRDAVSVLSSGGAEPRVTLRDGTVLPVGRTYRGELAEFVP